MFYELLAPQNLPRGNLYDTCLLIGISFEKKTVVISAKVDTLIAFCVMLSLCKMNLNRLSYFDYGAPGGCVSNLKPQIRPFPTVVR